ncbi:MAG: ATP-binding protein [Candidatus Gastranaerophilales bacterium]|nr:ATP-binding protein [Candidatus Gastranaerophilales bacterium]
MKQNYEIILQTLKLFFDTSSEAVIAVDSEKNILYSNKKFNVFSDKKSNLAQIEQNFNFDICILNETNLLKYNPISAAIIAEQNFKTGATFQVSESEFKEVIVQSYNYENLKVINIEDITAHKQNQSFKEENKILKLKLKEHEKNFLSKEKTELLAIRSSLLNRIAYSIRDMWNIDEIINTTVKEIVDTLGLLNGFFASMDKNTVNILYQYIPNSITLINLTSDSSIKESLEQSKTILSSNLNDAGQINPRLVTPAIYRGKILGILGFYIENSSREWHGEEINLIESISSLLATAINQANLFTEIEQQRQELEKTLKQLQDTQTQLIQSEKMASIGQLIAGVAHEINTPIGAINSNNDTMAKYIKKNNALPPLELFEEINSINTEAISRINRIVKSLKTFSRLDEAKLQEIDIHDGIKSTLTLINYKLKDKITLIENYENISKIKCYPDLLNQVFMNLLVNATQSIEKKGTIEIHTKQCNNNIEIRIKDTGKGISTENLNKIFDPGFTTKGVGVGTGLGLAIVYQIIDKHNGKINVNSEINKGSEFIIKLPISKKYIK